MDLTHTSAQLTDHVAAVHRQVLLPARPVLLLVDDFGGRPGGPLLP